MEEKSALRHQEMGESVLLLCQSTHWGFGEWFDSWDETITSTCLPPVKSFPPSLPEMLEVCSQAHTWNPQCTHKWNATDTNDTGGCRLYGTQSYREWRSPKEWYVCVCLCCRVSANLRQTFPRQETNIGGLPLPQLLWNPLTTLLAPCFASAMWVPANKFHCVQQALGENWRLQFPMDGWGVLAGLWILSGREKRFDC